ncbi:MAG: tRNA (adenosine(37)-N6)-dimethylallyltransferase MiaA [Paludibacteraceae bacterium]|nr:tRNA (adenosine(37)-N6)-dimethylallyltransferase MiaA [Paludibacteraceae bacterium]
MTKTLLVLLGPTGIGKTDLSLRLAKRYHCPVISSDSRQIYRGIEIGTAAPSKEEQSEVPHFFVGIKDLTESYSAGQYEQDVLALLDEQFQTHDYALLCGGSMMYIDAVCKGMDDVPTIPEAIRRQVHELLETQGLEAVAQRLSELDPVHYQRVDRKNTQRVTHALEVCLTLQRPYSSILTGQAKKRPFKIVKIGLERPRAELYDRINRRVEAMIADGLEEEARRVYPLKALNSLNTVGFKEWFDWWDGKTASREEVIRLIQQNSRHYAKRQLTWFRRDTEIRWFHPDQFDQITAYIDQCNDSDK